MSQVLLIRLLNYIVYIIKAIRLYIHLSSLLNFYRLFDSPMVFNSLVSPFLAQLSRCANAITFRKPYIASLEIWTIGPWNVGRLEIWTIGLLDHLTIEFNSDG